jgi:hypothetical protein
MTISREERLAIIEVVGYYYEEERINCEEEISLIYEDDFSSMSDKDLYNYCKEKDFYHIWPSLYDLKKIK